jgi:hypothetical protein
LLARTVQRVWDQLPRVREVNVEPLVDIELPERLGPAPWQWGKEAPARAGEWYFHQKAAGEGSAQDNKANHHDRQHP